MLADSINNFDRKSSERVEFLKVETVAAELHQTREHVLYLLRKRRLPGIKLGRKWLIPTEEFRKYVKELIRVSLEIQTEPQTIVEFGLTD